MKKNIPIFILISFMIFVIGGCANKTETLAELQKNQQQIQKELDSVKVEANNAKQKAQKYEKLADKYKNLMEAQKKELDELQRTYNELDKKDEAQVKVAKKAVQDKLIESAQNSIHLEKKLKRYATKAQDYNKKSQQLEEHMKNAQQDAQQTTQKIEQVKNDITAGSAQL